MVGSIKLLGIFKQLFCLHLNWKCLSINAYWFGWIFGRCHQCLGCGKRKVFSPGHEPVNFDARLRDSITNDLVRVGAPPIGFEQSNAELRRDPVERSVSPLDM